MDMFPYHIDSSIYRSIEDARYANPSLTMIVETKHKPFKVTHLYAKPKRAGRIYDYLVVWHQPKNKSYRCVKVKTRLDKNNNEEYEVGDIEEYSLTPVPMLIELHKKIDRLNFASDY